MLFLVIKLDGDRYAIRASDVVEVLPLVEWKVIPQGRGGLGGVFNYHGQPVPLLDLSQTLAGRPSRGWMSTRVVLVNCQAEPGPRHLLGLVAEQVTEVLRPANAALEDHGVAASGAAYLGPVVTDAEGILQELYVQHLLPGEVRGRLFKEAPLAHD